MKILFEPVSFGSLTVKNRLVRSATFDKGLAEDGRILPAMAEHYRRLAQGGVGLIITGMLGVCENSRSEPDMAQMKRDDFTSGLQTVVEAVHESGGKIAVQLGHTGAKAGVIEVGDHPWGPSDCGEARAMPLEELRRVTAAYGEAACKCKAAGADAVQIHSAHGYLLSQFLSPYYNRRTDEYGGGIENRARLLKEVYAAIRAAVGPEFPVLLKINYCDRVEGGLTGEECLWVCRELERMGLDGVEISSGLSIDRASGAVPRGKVEPFNGEYALEAAAALRIPVISVGGYRTVTAAEDYLNRGGIAAISLCRPLIREPDLPRRWQADPSGRAACVSCNQCFKASGVRCPAAAQN